jgi:hypothetical protein
MWIYFMGNVGEWRELVAGLFEMKLSAAAFSVESEAGYISTVKCDGESKLAIRICRVP